MTTTAISASRGRAWMIFTLVTMLLTACFGLMIITDTEQYKAQVQAEVDKTSQWLDSEAAYRISDTVQRRQRAWIYDSGFYPAIRDAITPKQVDYIDKASKGVFSTKWNIRLLMNGQYLAYQFIHRLTLIEFWLWTLLPLMGAMVLTGVFKWKIKQYQLGGQSVNVTRLWLKVFWALGATLSVYLFAPSAIGAASFYIPAIFLIVVAFAASQVIQSYNKYI